MSTEATTEPTEIWEVRVSSIACIAVVTQPDGLQLHAIDMHEDKSVPVVHISKMDGRDRRPILAAPDEVVDFVRSHFSKMFALQVEKRQAYIDKCKAHGPVKVMVGAPYAWQPCCLAESREMNGGCTNCGAPCL